ncbi:MAG TPA: hypothetical protein VLH56_04040 [Dissulfurispiraceae bacterium]|nr:hypothetical protein [Dissulfurispiraceae bacterium]
MIAPPPTPPTITLDDWLKAGLTFDMYKNDRRRGYLRSQGRGGNGRPVEIAWESIAKEGRKEALKAAGVDPASRRVRGFVRFVAHNEKAMNYYRAYRMDDGRGLPTDVLNECYTNACVLDAVQAEWNARLGRRRKAGGSVRGVWQGICREVAEMDRSDWNHTLPSHQRRLKQKLADYLKTDGYMSLIHKGYGNQNRRKVTGDVERLLLSLYCQDTKPFVHYVHELYHQFLGGVLDVYDVETGELFCPDDFIDDQGRALEISDSTVWNYVNMPHNRRVVDKYRSDRLHYDGLHRPHAHRKSPEYSLSKVSLDDRDLPRKMPDGARVKAYYAFDVASGCVIGAAYSKTKDTDLFIGCLRDMFRMIDRRNLGVPIEVEVEHHLVGNLKDELMRAGAVFPFVRWCNPGNSKEKRAEHMIKAKKLGVEKRHQAGIGRPFARLEAHRQVQEKVFNQHGMANKEKYLSMEELVADDRRANEIYNNSPHPNQKRYKGMTRTDVLLQRQNPNLGAIDHALLMRYIGQHTTTTIRRNQYVQVQYERYQLSRPDVVSKLQPNNLTVDAYYLAGDDGTVGQVHLWQGGVHIDSCVKLERFQEAKAEQTESDMEAYRKQAAYIASYDKSVKEARGRISKVKVMARQATDTLLPEVLAVTPDGYNEREYEFGVVDVNEYARRGYENI